METQGKLQGQTRTHDARQRPGSTEAGRRHRDAILSFAAQDIERTCRKRARQITSQTGSFTAAPDLDSDPLTSLDAFQRALRQAKGPATYVRGGHSKAAQAPESHKAFTAGAPPRHIEREPIREPGVVLAKVDGQARPSDRGKVVGWRERESQVETRRSLQVDTPNDLADDVYAQVLAELASLRGRAIPCHNCPRRFPFKAFLREAEERKLQPEQEEALRLLDAAHRNGDLDEACPVLWRALGESIPWRAGDELPYGIDADTIRARRGKRAGQEISLRCRMRALAAQYAWRAAIRYAYAAARRGRFTDERQDSEGNLIDPWEATDEAFEQSPEKLVVEQTARAEYLEYLVREVRKLCRTVSRGARMEKVLRLTAAEGEFPSGAEVAKRLGMPERSAQELLSSLKAFLSRIA